MTQPNTGRHAAESRLRPNRAPSRPALKGTGRDRAIIEGGLLNLIQRRRLAATIERLIALLDRFDAPAIDLEDSDSERGDEAEASLGWTVDGSNAATFTRQDCDCENDRADDEPSDGNDSGGDKLTTAWPECSV